MFKVLLVDDEDIDLEGLRQLIDWGALQMEVVAAVSSGFAALKVLREEPIDLLVTDIRMPIMSGLELSREALKLQPELKIVFISGYEDFQFARAAIRMNASDYLLKPIDDDEVMRTLQSVKTELEARERKPAAASGKPLPIRIGKNRKLIEEIDQYIREHMREAFTLKDAASYFSFSPNYFGQLFKESTGLNFSDYVREVRLSRAKELLADPTIKIFEVADQVGYKNLNHFSKHFRQAYGTTPGDYRRQG